MNPIKAFAWLVLIVWVVLALASAVILVWVCCIEPLVNEYRTRRDEADAIRLAHDMLAVRRMEDPGLTIAERRQDVATIMSWQQFPERSDLHARHVRLVDLQPVDTLPAHWDN